MKSKEQEIPVKSCTLSCKKGGSEEFTDNKEVEISPTLPVKPGLL